METYTVPIVGISTIAEGTLELRLKKPDGFAYKAGQFVMLELPQMGETVPGPEKTRAMSMASAPHEEDLLLVMRIPENPSSFKQAIRTLRVGDEVLIEGPAGHFTLPEEMQGPLVFLAGGIGITPFRGMVLEEMRRAEPRPITLLYSNRTIEQAAYLKELREVSMPNYTFVPTLTQSTEEVVKQYGCRQGRITAALIAETVREPRAAQYFIVGTNDMVRAMRELLLGMNIEKTHIHLEMYPGY